MAAIAAVGAASAQVSITGTAAWGFYSSTDTAGATASGFGIDTAQLKFSAKEDDRNDNVLVKMRAFCKSMAEKVKGRMIVTKTSVIDLKISE